MWETRLKQALHYLKHERMIIRQQGHFIRCFDSLSNTLRLFHSGKGLGFSRMGTHDQAIIKVPKNVDPFNFYVGIIDFAREFVFEPEDSSSLVETSTDDE